MPARKPLGPVAPEVCPVCGEDVPRNALACPGCGADDRSGWREDAAIYDGADLPDEFDYDEYVREEFGTSIKPRGISSFWWIVAVLIIIALCLVYARQIGL